MEIKITRSYVPSQYRQYIDSPDDAPDDVQVQQGDKDEDAYYYDTRETNKLHLDEISSNSDSLDDINQLYEDKTEEELGEWLENNPSFGSGEIIQYMYHRKSDDDVLDEVIDFDVKGTNHPDRDFDLDDVKDTVDNFLQALNPGIASLTAKNQKQANLSTKNETNGAMAQVSQGKFMDVAELGDRGDKTIAHEMTHVIQDVFCTEHTGFNDIDSDPDQWTPNIEGGKDNMHDESEEFLNKSKELFSNAVEKKKEDIQKYGEDEELMDNEISTYQWQNANEFMAEAVSVWWEDRQKLQSIYPEVADYLDEKLGKDQ